MHLLETRKGFAILATLSVIVPGGVAFAQDTGTIPPPKPERPLRAFLDTMENRKEERIENRQEIKGELKDVRKNALDDRKDLRIETRDAIKNASSTDEKKDILRGALGERLNIVKDRIASTTAVKREALKNLVERHFGANRERFNVALRHLDGLLERIESRIEKMEANGIDTSAVDSALAEAKTAIATAKADVAELGDLIQRVKDTDDKTTIREQLQTAMKKAIESIKTAQKELKEVVRILLDIGKQNRDTASTTSAN